MHEVRAAIVAATVRAHPFRPPRADEALDAYFGALLEHVSRVVDMSTLWELHFDKRQADWTPAEVETFLEASKRDSGPRDTFTKGVHTYQFLQTYDHPVTDAELLRIGERGLASQVQLRQDQPTRELAPVVSVLLLNGECWTTVVPSEDRLALIKHLARTQPVFGFILTADAWMHQVDTKTHTAKKREGIMQHLGSRTVRLSRIRPYTITKKGRVVFDDPPPPDFDPRTEINIDPYADVFVSVPPPTGPPS